MTKRSVVRGYWTEQNCHDRRAWDLDEVGANLSYRARRGRAAGRREHETGLTPTCTDCLAVVVRSQLTLTSARIHGWMQHMNR
jgi:hypothetical protein